MISNWPYNVIANPQNNELVASLLIDPVAGVVWVGGDHTGLNPRDIAAFPLP